MNAYQTLIKMTKSKVNFKIIIYYLIVTVLIALSLYNFNINRLFFSILIGILLVFMAVNRATIIKIKNNTVFIVDYYLFVPFVRKKYVLSYVNSIKVTKEKISAGLGYSDNIFADIFIGYLLGFFWSQATCAIEFNLKTNNEQQIVNVNSPIDQVKKILLHQ